MTCIAGVRIEGRGVILGGDSHGANEDSGMSSSFRAPKVFRLTPQIAAGFMGSFRMGQLIQHHLEPPDLVGDELTWAIRKLVPEIRAVFKDHGLATIEHNEETAGEWLLAVRDRLFQVQADYSVLEAREGYDAVGCGEQLAMGAMHALSPRYGPKAKPRAMLKAALDAASAFSLGVGPPYNFTQTRL